MLFETDQIIDNKYTITFPYKEAPCAETYRVKDESGRPFFLKLIIPSALKISQFTKEEEILEVEIVEKLSHPNLCSLTDKGHIISMGQQLTYYVTDFVSSETVAQKMSREETLMVYEAKEIAKATLHALSYLHTLDRPIIHNNVTTQNVLIDLSSQGFQTSRIIGFSHARYADARPSTDDLDALNPFYLAPERFNGICSIQTDIYAVGAMLYHMIFGMPPWVIDLSLYDKDDQTREMLARRCSPLKIPSMRIFDMDDQLARTLAKALAYEAKKRFQSAEEFLQALEGNVEVEKVENEAIENATGHKQKRKGNGFADVAGMDALKEQLQSDVIDLLKNPGRAKELGLSIPNGILFYGPPGCGKTFFAERFAEEIGCSYMYVLCSDVASPYIHGGQGKIAKIFEEARKAAPTILFLDEVEAMITDRNKHNTVSEQGEVNEFLAQLNNCGAEGVMVIGATNNPKIIDPAALRAGRLELKYYIPQPDEATRSELFRIGLRDRRTELGIDYQKLSQLTAGRVSSDIKLIIDTAARIVFKRNIESITQEILEEAIAQVKPTVSAEEIKQCEKIRDEFNGKKEQRPRIGF